MKNKSGRYWVTLKGCHLSTLKVERINGNYRVLPLLRWLPGARRRRQTTLMRILKRSMHHAFIASRVFKHECFVCVHVSLFASFQCLLAGDFFSPSQSPFPSCAPSQRCPHRHSTTSAIAPSRICATSILAPAGASTVQHSDTASLLLLDFTRS